LVLPWITSRLKCTADALQSIDRLLLRLCLFESFVDGVHVFVSVKRTVDRLSVDTCGLTGSRKKYPVGRIIDIDSKLLKYLSPGIGPIVLAGDNVVGFISLWTLDAGPFK
jgi:hypothetical protein